MPDLDRTAPYVLLPQRLCIDLRDNPVALGTYALLARLFLLTHQSIPLSAGDLERFDQQTSYGQARRALARLSESGWLQVTALGRKNAYLPTWGLIHTIPRPWCFTAEKFGRPPHVRTYRISAMLLDQIAYLTPHPRLPAVIHQSHAPCSLTQLGIYILESVGLRSPTAEQQQPASSSFEPTTMIDQLIPQPIDQPAHSSTPHTATECGHGAHSTSHESIPWDSWDMNLMNQQAIPCSNNDRVEVAGMSASHCTTNKHNLVDLEAPAPGSQEHTSPVCAGSTTLHPAIQAGHAQLNSGRLILPGEWYELRMLERQHGVKRMLVWQARAQRRHMPIERITPAYYTACALRDQIEVLPTQHVPSGSDQQPQIGNMERVDSGYAATIQQGMPAGPLAEQLCALGIRSLAGLGSLDPQLVDAWVRASKHPQWPKIWDDPAGAARALLLRGEAPPSEQVIERRAARTRAIEPTNWAAVVAASGGGARLGDDLSDLVDLVESRRAGDRADDPCEAALPHEIDFSEQIRMTLRLHVSSRPAFQAVERLHAESSATTLIVHAATSADRPVLQGLIPVLGRVAGGRQVVVR